jgi:Rrf2 family transcriptional regulator, repressor of oqxAB
MNSGNLLNLGWFNVAVQALVVLAETDGACPSGTLAKELKAHEVFLRRVLAQLVRIQIVEAREGRHGGYSLARPADRITLAQIYKAVKSANSTEEAAAGRGMNVGVQAALDEIGDEVEACLLDVLEHYTIAQVMEQAVHLSSPPESTSSIRPGEIG